ncbi:MAG: endonuclease III [Nanoarchaeota archaeon]|nr:endonuclease III [Nanoarchaeota archaeon]
MNKKQYFLKIFKKVQKKYGDEDKRLAAEGWGPPWRTLVVTIMSAQSRDETTISIAEKLFKKYPKLENLAKAKFSDVLKILKSMNYNRTKSRNVIEAAKMLVNEFKGKVPRNIDELVKIPGVGRKTANLVLSEVYGEDTITIDTHCHRIPNAIGLVKTKTPMETELALQKIVPKKYWNRINRLFVLWGKDCLGHDKKKLLAKLDE